MSVIGATYSVLANDGTVPGLLATSTSIFQLMAEQGSPAPYIVVSYDQTDPERSKDGNDIEHYPVQVDIYTSTDATRDIDTAEAIADAVKTALEGYSNSSIEGVNIDKVIYQGRVVLEDVDTNGPAPMYVISMGFRYRVKV